MKRTLGFFCILVLSLNLILSCGNSKEKPGLLVATAANMQFAMEELSEQFKKDFNINCELVVSSSGKLTAQIKEGAPYDVFVSADMKFPQAIDHYSKAVTTPKVYAYGKLVLWSMTELPHLNGLTQSHIKHIALANPKTAPYGKAALEVLEYTGIVKQVESKFVFGESIAQTNQFITTQAAQIGFTAKSVVVSPLLKNKGQWVDISTLAYTPIEQGIVVIKQNEKDRAQAMKFYNFMFSDKAKQILTKYGYDVGE